MSQPGAGLPLISASKPWLRILPAAIEHSGLSGSVMARFLASMRNSAAWPFRRLSRNSPFSPISTCLPVRGSSSWPFTSVVVCGVKMLV
ncbi:hypothetical protein A9973_18540 [Achromobacter sp. UMC46]|nr:hypothetical protein [Achromobacter sp. UMC46]